MPVPVAQMTPAAATTAVRSATAHDADTQVTDTQIAAELDREYRRVRRWLSSFLPELYQKVASFTIASPTNALTKPDDFERVTRLEQMFSQGYYQPLTVRAQLHASQGIARDCSGTYRLTYVARPVDGYTAYDVPEGAEDILISLVAAWVKQRHEEDPTYFMQRAAQLKDEIRSSLVMRYGAHPRSLMSCQYGQDYVGSFYEEAATIVIV
jgi:hypothetical protein